MQCLEECSLRIPEEFLEILQKKHQENPNVISEGIPGRVPGEISLKIPEERFK